MASSRKDSRDALATLLEAALVGDGLPVKTVSAHKEERLEGNSPLVVVLSRGTVRERMTFAGDQATFEFLVQVWVLQKATGWTQEQAEDALDRIESLIAETFETNRSGTEWEILEYGGQSQVFEASVAGVPYYVESIPTVVRLARN
jgi:hypothetical protein